MARRNTSALVILLVCAWLWSLPGQALALDNGQDKAPSLAWIEFSMGSAPVKVKAGGFLSIHPDAPFRVTGISSSSWLNFGLQAKLADLPTANLEEFHTLSELLGPRIYEHKQLVVEAFKGDQVLGRVTLLIRFLPIDWLRKAESSGNLSDKIKFTQKALELDPDDQLLVTRLADLFTEAKRYDEAAKLLEDQAAQNEDPAWLKRLAKLYRQLDQPQKEAAVLSKLLASGPADPENLERLAMLHQRMGDWQAAAVILERLINLKTGLDRASLYQQLAVDLAKAGQAQRSAQAWDQAVKLAPGDVDLWRNMAKAKTQAGDAKGALQALKRASQLAPRDRDLLLELAQAYLALPDDRQAAQVMERLLEQTPGDQGLLKRLSQTYERLGDRKGLMRTQERMLKLNPGDKDLRYNLALLEAKEQESAGDRKKALSALQKAHEIDPGNQDLLLKIANLQRELGDNTGQLKTYGLLVKQNPKDPDLHYNLAVLAMGQEKYKLALSHLEKANALKPGDQESQELTLEALVKLRRWKQAKKQALSLLKNSKHPLKLFDLFYPLLEDARPGLLADLLDAAIGKHPKNIKFYEMRAALALEHEEPDQAIDALQKAVEALPKNLDLLMKLAQIYESQGRIPDALDTVGRIMDKDPEFPKAEEYYLRLKTKQLSGKAQKKAGSGD